MRLRRPIALSLAALALVLADAPRALSAPSAAFRRTDATPDAMVDAALARATAPGATEHALAASLAVMVALANRAANGHVEQALARVASTSAAAPDLRAEASLMGRMISGSEGTEAGARANHALGMVEAVSVLGPFRDTGGGLLAHDGPEAEKVPFETSARYAWGSYDVAWREVPRAFAQATGIPLDVFIHPRKESCSWVAAALDVSRAQPIVVRAASTGQVRLVFDGTELARDEAVHSSLRFDRLAVRVDATAGRHLLAAKVCSGALDDDGQVRLRVTDDAGAWPEGVTEAPWSSGGLRPGHKFSAHPQTTVLSQSMAKSDGDIDSRLDVAVLRTLGGADDLRSPRAPGLLASIAEGGVDADGLATAGSIAPIGANRTAWLNRAREKGDAGTRAFAERRLVERHVQAGMADWGMATLQGAKIDQEKDAEAVLLTSQVELALGTDALRVRALHRLESIARSLGDATPDAILQALARTAEGLEPGAALGALETLAARGEWGPDEVRVSLRFAARRPPSRSQNAHSAAG